MDYVYVNGVLKASGGIYPDHTRSSSTSPITIGGSAWDGYFNGLIDEFAIYNRTLSASEIQQHFSSSQHYIGMVSVCQAGSYYCDGDGDNHYGTTPTGTCNTYNCVPQGCTWAMGDDCDDTNANVHPNQEEACNGIDDNCIDGIDEGVTTTYYRDADGDSFGDVMAPKEACALPSGYVTDSTDCDDGSAAVNPDATDTNCDGIDDNCNGPADEGYVPDTSCYLPGVCAGHNQPSSCVNGVETSCQTGTPSQELCDAGQLDENCNAESNEGCECNEGATRSCGPDTGTGECEFGTQSCDINGQWGGCSGEVMPATETCDGKDNDCDGTTDNGFDVGAACTNGLGQCEHTGVKVCNAQHDGTICDAVPGQSSTETCDGLDNDCDGVVDMITRNCAVEYTGICAVGTETCDGGHWDGCPASQGEYCPDDGQDDNCDGTSSYDCASCDSDGDGYRKVDSNPELCTGYLGVDCDDANANVHPGATEICNGIDDNCDGSTDEGFDVDTDGFTSCNGDCNDNNGNVNPSATEICNGIDDNCMNGIDEGVKFTFYRDADGDGFGNADITEQACEASTGYVPDNTDCNDNSAAINPAESEVPCDGIDNDCSGTDDEGTDADHDGYKPQGGACGSVDCDDNDPNNYPTNAEVCDGQDNDCDGSIDAADSGLVLTPCEKQDGVCANSYHAAGQCSDGQWQACDGSNYGSGYHDEYCPDDGVDNNCDGVSGYDCIFNCDKDNDGFKPDNAPWYCFGYQPGDCDDGNNAVHPGVADTCNGVDDDCNANTADGFNEDWYGMQSTCGTGDCIRMGQWACQNGEKTNDCTPGQPTAETCDNRDNNCDGIIDEITQSCALNNQGICALGTQLCSAGQWSDCPAPRTELCNGVDDDCDGSTDEDSKIQITYNAWQNWGKKGDIDLYGIAPYTYADSLAGSPFASGAFIPVNTMYTTANKNVAGLSVDSGVGYFDVWFWGKHDGIQKEAVNATLYLDGIKVTSIQNIQGNAYEKMRDGKAVFGKAGQDQVWVQSGNLISFVATASGNNDAFRVNYVKASCTGNDADQDTIPDYLDVCPNSISDAGIDLEDKHFADVNGNSVFETVEKKAIISSAYTLQDTFGCTCKDILGVKPGADDGQLKHGCTKGTIEKWTTTMWLSKVKP